MYPYNKCLFRAIEKTCAIFSRRYDSMICKSRSLLGEKAHQLKSPIHIRGCALALLEQYRRDSVQNKHTNTDKKT